MPTKMNQAGKTRLGIRKTPKCYLGGAFVRSESGRVFPWLNEEGKVIANIPQCSRKDLRNAVEAAARACPGWTKMSGYLRGQILYRFAEMLEARAAELSEVLQLGGLTEKQAQEEVLRSVDRVVYYAGWADKYEQVLGSVNPVATAHFNFTVTEPVGVVGVIAPDKHPLLALISLIVPAIVSGNSVAALASATNPLTALVLGEILATSDVPGGVVNVLTGNRTELLPTFATHKQIRVIVGVGDPAERVVLRKGAADGVKKVVLRHAEDDTDWTDARFQSAEMIADSLEFKTVWHPVGI